MLPLPAITQASNSPLLIPQTSIKVIHLLPLLLVQFQVLLLPSPLLCLDVVYVHSLLPTADLCRSLRGALAQVPVHDVAASCQRYKTQMQINKTHIFLSQLQQNDTTLAAEHCSDIGSVWHDIGAL